jgi:hypothetical protein
MRSKKTRIMSGEKVSGNNQELEAFLAEAGCLPSQKVPKQAFTRAETEESDFDVEEEFPSRRAAARKASRGRGVGAAKARQPKGVGVQEVVGKVARHL